VGHLLLHHVEALVAAERGPALDPFAAFSLRALAQSPATTLADLEGRLHLGLQVVGRLLDELAAAGLAEADAAGGWRASAAGRALAAGGEPRRTAFERRAFHFRDAPPGEFVPIDGADGSAVAPPPGWSFDPAALRRCIEQPAAWKRGRRFPAEVRALLTPDLVLALVVVAADGEELRGFVVEPRGWVLSAARPVLAIGRGWAESFPELAQGPQPEAWRGVWRTWCQNHGVQPAEADACALRREGPLLRVVAPGDLRGRLHTANGEAGRDEVWLLAGEGRMRTAARVELSV
jgi:hypothetical protein